MPDASISQTTNLEFSIGQIVVPLATPSISGAVTKIIPGRPENRYVIFIPPAVEHPIRHRFSGLDIRVPVWAYLTCQTQKDLAGNDCQIARRLSDQ